MAVQNEHLLAGDGPTVAGLAGGGRDALFVPATVLLGERHRGDGLARGDAGKVGLLGLVVVGVDEGVGGQHHAGEVRRTEEGSTHLLENHDQLDVGVATPTELLGDDQTLQPHLFGHLGPDGVVVALLGVHLLPDRRFGGLVLEELADDPAELFLLLAECEVHAFS